jgi:hypothetical protein
MRDSNTSLILAIYMYRYHALGQINSFSRHTLGRVTYLKIQISFQLLSILVSKSAVFLRKTSKHDDKIYRLFYFDLYRNVSCDFHWASVIVLEYDHTGS